LNALNRLFLVILMLMPLSAIFASGASCDITASPSTVSIDSDYSQNPGRATIFGSADGKFNENTKVEINCNVDGTLPGANENIAAAKITPSASQLSYTGYCTYKASGKDIDYKAGVTILLDDAVCTGGFCYSRIACNKDAASFAKVAVKASAKAAVAQAPECGLENQKPCTACPTGKTCKNGCIAPYVANGSACVACASGTVYAGGTCSLCGNEGQFACSGGTCNSGLAVATDGVCVQNNAAPAKQPECGPTNACPTGKVCENGACIISAPKVDGWGKELRYALDWKWSLIGVPYGGISSEDHSCISKIYWYDPKINAYMTVTDLKDKSLIGKGLWAKRASPKGTGGDCTVKYTGSFLPSQTVELKKGWNLVSVQTEKGIDAAKSGCNILKGPFTYSGFIENGKAQGYYKRDYLNSGSGYWIKVADTCKLISEEEADQPPAAPE